MKNVVVTFLLFIPHFPHNKANATNSCGQIFKMKTEMYSATAEKML